MNLNYSKLGKTELIESGSTPLIEAIKCNSFNFVDAVISVGADVNMPGYNSETPLMAACCYADTEIVKLLVDAGADINEFSNGVNALLYACRFGNSDTVKLLLERGAFTGMDESSPKRQPLFEACKYEDLLIISFLLEFGANADYVFGINSNTYLITAILEAKHDVVKMLLLGNANPNIKGEHGQTALHHAITMNDIDTVWLLLQSGAHIHSKNDAELSPLDLARQSKNIVLMAIVTEAHGIRTVH